MKNAVILLSGGLDSTTCLALARAQGYNCFALSFNYSQRHIAELQAAQKIAAHYTAKHMIATLPTFPFGDSALTNAQMTIPPYNNSDQIPVTYVPARNTIFLSIALGWAEALEAYDIFIGISAVDYSHYPDCRPAFLHAFQQLADVATKTSVESQPIRIHAPLIALSKAETLQLGHRLGVDYKMTVSCYQANEQGEACGQCESCALRQKGFLEANLPDATRYVTT